MRFFLPFICLLALCSCGPNYVLNEALELPNQSWTYADSLVSNFDVTDEKASYNLYLQVKHNEEFPTQNLYVRLKTTAPQGPPSSETISLQLADKAGNWLGKCSGEKCQILVPVKNGLVFGIKGQHRLVVEQFMRSENVKGLEKISLLLEVVKK